MSYFPNIVDNYLPFGSIFLLITCIHVAFARVFFHCHYIGDVIGGLLIGVVLQ